MSAVLDPSVYPNLFGSEAYEPPPKYEEFYTPPAQRSAESRVDAVGLQVIRNAENFFDRPKWHPAAALCITSSATTPAGALIGFTAQGVCAAGPWFGIPAPGIGAIIGAVFGVVSTAAASLCCRALPD